MSTSSKIFLIVYLCLGAESRSIYPYNNYSAIKYNDIGDEVDEVHENHLIDHDEHSNYSYEYRVNSPHTGDYKSQQEERIGDVVRGSYSFIESDGRKRIVEYTADPIHGFNAIVKHVPVGAHHLQRSASIQGLTPPTAITLPTPLSQSSVVPYTSSTVPPYNFDEKAKKLFYHEPTSPLPLIKSISPTPYIVSRPPKYGSPFLKFVNWPFVPGA